MTGDVLGQMLLARDEDGQGLNDTELRDEVMTLMLAGHEVSSKLRVVVISDIEAIMLIFINIPDFIIEGLPTSTFHQMPNILIT